MTQLDLLHFGAETFSAFMETAIMLKGKLKFEKIAKIGTFAKCADFSRNFCGNLGIMYIKKGVIYVKKT